jgi:hypothetical protein
MRKAFWMATAALVILSPLALGAQEQSQQQQPQPPPSQEPKPQPKPADSLAEAARKARAEKDKKSAPKAPIVWTNDNIPKKPGVVSIVGEAPAPPKEGKDAEGAQTTPKENADKKSPLKNEAYWRATFAEAHKALQRARTDLSILQRELSELQVAYYPDPQKALKQQYTREDINKKQAAIDAKQKDIEQLQQNLSNLEDELRQSGGDPGWASE